MNPRIPVDYAEAGRWLQNFAASHAKRESPRLEASVEMDEAREGRSYGVRLILGAAAEPPGGAPPIELAYAEVAEGRTRFAWCEGLADRLRADARRLLAQGQRDEPGRTGGSRSA